MKRILNLVFALLMVGLGAPAYSVDVSVGGYADAQFNMGWTNTAPTWDTIAAQWTTEKMEYQTFRFNKGAIKLSATLNNVSAMVDVDLQGPAIQSTRGFSTGTVGTGIDVAETQSQAYLTSKYENGFDWMLGQFDSRYGYEANDTDSVRYSDQGVLWSLMPVTHVGGLLGYGFSEGLRFEVLVANAYDQGILREGNLDLGAKLYADLDTVNFNLGFLGSTGDRNNAGLKKELGYIIDLSAGLEVAGHDLTLYGAFKKPDHKDPIYDFGYGADFGLDPDVGLGYGLRLEYASVADDKIVEATLGPQYHFTSDFVTKFDYTYTNKNHSNALQDNRIDHAINLAAVYSF